MSNVNIFQNNTKSCPTGDNQIIRVDMEQNDLLGRKSHLPATQKAPGMMLNHVPNAGSTMK